jgi:hypothetical protein
MARGVFRPIRCADAAYVARGAASEIKSAPCDAKMFGKILSVSRSEKTTGLKMPEGAQIPPNLILLRNITIGDGDDIAKQIRVHLSIVITLVKHLGPFSRITVGQGRGRIFHIFRLSSAQDDLFPLRSSTTGPSRRLRP